MTEKERLYTELLIIRCGRGDNAACAELVSLWERRLFYYIRRLVDGEEEAWDVLQETWLAVFRGIGTLRKPSSLPMWLYRVARNKAANHIRDRIVRREHEDYSIPVDEYSETDNGLDFEDADEVHRALDRLSLPHREVLTLFFLEDLTVQEMAELLEIPGGTVKSRLHYAKRALRSLLEREV